MSQLLIQQENTHEVGYRYSILLLEQQYDIPVTYRSIKNNPASVLDDVRYTDRKETFEELWLKYVVLKGIAYEPHKNKAIKQRAERFMQEYLNYFKNLPLSANQDIQLAEDALGLDNPPLALSLYERAIHKAPDQNAYFYTKVAQTALWAKQCVKSAEYYFIAQHKSQTLNDKRYLFVRAVRLLIGCNEYELAIRMAERNIGILRQDALTYEVLTNLALSADQPEKAKLFVLKLLQLKEESNE
ncbi:hypothetical protein E3983_05145 [Legionella israelensis]|uniref:Tetratricopeptide repeat protein n=1 Tax=Legionella israelensis TaxID=454 RepID=A0AAX1EFC0_9GAMM|nr:hypothetical protein [Legionella israelensis]QBR83789.1 hypothetical protein E3983_05145 [Legionella israelensis]